jgi:hypothetical protein
MGRRTRGRPGTALGVSDGSRVLVYETRENVINSSDRVSGQIYFYTLRWRMEFHTDASGIIQHWKLKGNGCPHLNARP